MNDFTDTWTNIINADKKYEKETGHSCFENIDDIRKCPICKKQIPRTNMQFTHNCHGITFRLVCNNCYDKIMNEKGYDGEYYSKYDECIDDDY